MKRWYEFRFTKRQVRSLLNSVRSQRNECLIARDQAGADHLRELLMSLDRQFRIEENRAKAESGEEK